MRPTRRRAAIAAAGLAGLLVGAVTTLALTEPPVPGGASGPVASSPPSPGDTASGVAGGGTGGLGTGGTGGGAAPHGAEGTGDPATSTTAPAADPDTLLVWTSGGLPPGLAAPVAALDGVRSVTVVRGGEAALVGSALPDGTVVDQLVDGWHLPLDVIAIDPATFPGFASDAAAPVLAALAPGEALLTETSAQLRRLGVGSTVRLETGEVRVAGIIDDLSGAGAELVAHSSDAAGLGVGTERYLLVGHDGDRAGLQQRIATEVVTGHTVRFRSPAETTWLRHGDGVEPQAWVKAAYGEFAVRERPGREVEVDPAWVERSIVTEEVPILGQVTCHREVVGRLRAALSALSDANLDHLVDPAGFAGCYSPRRIAAGQPMSRHAWGAALDINVGANPRGSFSTQDPRLVEAMRANGFTWGGTWLVPDPAHYEATTPGG